ncbi:TspO protein [Mucilaginibacter sp. PPCGB 2223]|uniref:TspO/MBR family protein n=1 Tax=Mucilaginibacter sp. PPCGB 2223 TaxID=1886027 RepID=UPI000826FE23|nr:TspO/MBR family protein [Mucilaginibacter sp. PPCGB 2223]OCX52906.1 TspO protein [Mucilaginibacter sp. PPCGB 2223]
MNIYAHKAAFRLLPLLISVGITLSIGGLASYLIAPQMQVWYPFLQKPSFNPPNWIFAPVWSVLYVMIGVSACLVWQQRRESVDYINSQYSYFLQLLFNFSWPITFFGLHQIFAALVVIILLWLSIAANIFYFSKLSRPAAWLLVPYLLWVSFAGLLNFYIYLLN